MGERGPSISIMALDGTASVHDLHELGVTGVRVAPGYLCADGALSPDGIRTFRDAWSEVSAAGMEIHLVTPWPGALPAPIGNGAPWARRWRRLGSELAEALGDMVTSWQLGNELNIFYFRSPLATTAEAARFVEALGSGIRAVLPTARLGINAFGTDAGAEGVYDALYGEDARLRLDFIGIDAYFGSWQSGGPDDWRRTIDRVWQLGRGRPVAVCEVGFPSRGAISEPGELEAYLARLGYASSADVEADRGRLLAAAPPSLAESIAALPSASWEEDFEDNACHLLGKWRHTWGAGPQTPEKQAAYFGACLDLMVGDPRISEVMLFLYQDLATCWTCGQEACPLETAWGFVDLDGLRKPVFETVRSRLAATAVQ